MRVFNARFQSVFSMRVFNARFSMRVFNARFKCAFFNARSSCVVTVGGMFEGMCLLCLETLF